MPNKDKNIPKRRFKEFENADAWELRKLGEVGTVAMCRRIFKEQTSEHGEIPFYKIGTFGGPPDAFIARELFEEFKDKYSYPNIGDILISASGSIGRAVEFLGEDEYFQDSNIVWLKHDGKINNIFLKQFYSIVKWSGIEGSTIKRLYNENILNTEIALPTLAEQEAIGTFFSTLDQHITLHQRKLDKLKSVKQAYLSEMFPAEGERVPKRRFPGFTDDWELRKLVNEVLFVGTGKSKFSALEFGEFEILGSTSVIGYDNSYDYEGDFILTARVGANAGELYRHSGKVKISDNTVFIQGDGLDFIFYILQHFDIKKLSFGTGQPLVKASELKELKILMPVSVKERNHVGTFFSTLDRHITLHQRKLEKLKNLKKALLNELFV